ncbi:hypothetical protein EBU95_02095 [bacterium]|nr:hypothetical protein [bacterium]
MAGGTLFQKVVLKPSEYTRKTCFVIGNDQKENNRVVSELVHKLSNLLCNTKESKFSKTITVYSNAKNKYTYKKMLLENPYMYFTDFDIQRIVSPKGTIPNGVIIIDFQTLLEDGNIILKMLNNGELANGERCVIIVNNLQDASEVVDVYKQTRGDKIMIYKKSHLKMSLRHFYKNIIEPLCSNCTYSFDKFYNVIHDENLDMYYLVLDNFTLGYN